MNIMSKAHGKRTTYIKGCRCDECRGANNVYMAQYQRKRAKNITHPVWRNYRTWEPWEDELAMDYTLSAWQIAGMLNRTPAAVINRRRIFHARRNNQKEEQK